LIDFLGYEKEPGKETSKTKGGFTQKDYLNTLCI
jgi:hypothetical protein